MDDELTYQFEEISADLPRPPMIAIRALHRAGALVSPQLWPELPVQTRKAIARLGAADVVDVDAVRSLVNRLPPTCIRMVRPTDEVDAEQVPTEVVRALAPGRTLDASQWRMLRGRDRSVLLALHGNKRLLYRAHDEIFALWGQAPLDTGSIHTAAVACCELRLHACTFPQLTAIEFHQGRALTFARVAGVRAARRISETLDSQSTAVIGSVELDWGPAAAGRGVLWQGHVSSWDGEFSPAASLLAVTTAATAVYDMIRQHDPGAAITNAAVREQAWEVGSGWMEEEATVAYGGLGDGNSKAE